MIPLTRLSSGQQMPLLGYGTWQIPPRLTKETVAHAIAAGYRHIDTAAIYGTETGVGEAVRASGMPRKDFFITTKLWNADHGNVRKALEHSTKTMGTAPDLWIMHWPMPQRLASWKEMEALHREGKVASIGVSNFTRTHLEQLLEHAEIIPAVNQVEFSPFLFQKDLLAFCQTHKIQLVAYSPLTHGQKLDHPGLGHIAKHYQATPAQVLLAWALQHHVAVIPKTVHQDRMQENAHIRFTVTEKDMNTLDSLHVGLRTCWNPEDFP